MKATRVRAARIHSFRFTVVLRSSSMMPIFTVLSGNPSRCSILDNVSLANFTSSGPCIFGLTMYMEPAGEFIRSPVTSTIPIATVVMASIIPSGTSFPSRVFIRLVVIKWPTLRISNNDRPRSWPSSPFGRVMTLSGFSVLSTTTPSFLNDEDNEPSIRPSQLL